LKLLFSLTLSLQQKVEVFSPYQHQHHETDPFFSNNAYIWHNSIFFVEIYSVFECMRNVSWIFKVVFSWFRGKFST